MEGADDCCVHRQLGASEQRQPIDDNFQSPAIPCGSLRSKSCTRALVVTRPPASRQMRAATSPPHNLVYPAPQLVRMLRGDGHEHRVGGHTGKYARSGVRVNWKRRKRVMRNTSYSREVTRHVKRERPAPGPACDLTNAQEASPILNKSCVSRWLLSLWKTLRAATQCGIHARNQQGLEVVWWLERVQSKRAKREVQNPFRRPSSWLLRLLLRDTVPLFRHPTRAGTRPRSQGSEHGSLGGNQPNWPNKRAPSCAQHYANQDLPKRKCGDFSNCLCALVQIHLENV